MTTCSLENKGVHAVQTLETRVLTYVADIVTIATLFRSTQTLEPLFHSTIVNYC